jgi:hypothetical protein
MGVQIGLPSRERRRKPGCSRKGGASATRNMPVVDHLLEFIAIADALGADPKRVFAEIIRQRARRDA